MRTIETIDLTPTWESLALQIAELATNATTFESQKIGKEELQRMARLADKWVEHEKQRMIVEDEASKIQESNFTRLPSDMNGNPRYYLPLYLAPHDIARAEGGTVYRGKQYGAGWVFQTYALKSICDALNAK